MPARIQTLLWTALSVLLVLAALVWLWHELRALDMAQLAASLRALPGPALWAAAALTLASHAVYAGFDLIGRRVGDAPISARRTLAIGWIGYAFSLSLGPAGLAPRFRLYRQAGVTTGAAARIWALTLATNWLGFALIAGAALLWAGPRWAAAWAGFAARHAPWAPQAAGAALLAAALVYLVACERSARRGGPWPGAALAALQCALSCANWLLIAGVLHALLRGALPFSLVLAAVLASAAALAIVDVPAGLGVLEAVFIAMLGSQLPLAELVAVLAAYRVIYFLVPLGFALVAYAGWEWRLQRSG